MPKYTFICERCKKNKQYFVDISEKQKECECGSIMYRQLPFLRGTKTTEVIDKYTNVKHLNDQSSMINERKLDYYWQHEVPKMVNSGIYELSTMLQQGWVYYNEKNELVTRTKPPQKL